MLFFASEFAGSTIKAIARKMVVRNMVRTAERQKICKAHAREESDWVGAQIRSFPAS